MEAELGRSPSTSTAGPPWVRFGEGLPSPGAPPSTYKRRGRAPLLDTSCLPLNLNPSHSLGISPKPPN